MTKHCKPSKPAGDYRVGYRRPPPGRRFKQGKSGNPRGRPKGRKSLGRVLIEALSRRITVQENGKDRKMLMRDVIVQGLVNDAARRDPKAVRLLFALIGRYGDSLEQDTDMVSLLLQDETIIAEFVASLTAQHEDGRDSSHMDRITGPQKSVGRGRDSDQGAGT